MDDLRKELDSQSVGDIKVVTVNFGFAGEGIKRINMKELGGGGVMDIGCYAVMFVNFIFGREKPEKIVASGQLMPSGWVKPKCLLLPSPCSVI